MRRGRDSVLTGGIRCVVVKATLQNTNLSRALRGAAGSLQERGKWRESVNTSSPTVMNNIKLALLGSKGAGKTAVLVRFLTKRFIGEYASTANSLYHKRMSIDGKQLNLEIFDPCSQPPLPCPSGSSGCILEEPVNWADGFVVVYDISDQMSFFHAKSILQQIKEARQEICKGLVDLPVFLVGNKQDLCNARQVHKEEGQSLAQEDHCLFQEVSAADDFSEISGVFTKLIRHVTENFKYRTDRRRYSGSKSMAKLINNVFGKRRKSV